ncbi:unnamed protein product [Fraxinus pennsylvanica]|uniref:DUF4283 domain-containing protein n=1 Tax=Fraxinus pennsylvanica TaxID=56036 RepID=A0AAD2AID6_9LAMI|nr:unnamed protein product [Fraxinus pennsylvanica]
MEWDIASLYARLRLTAKESQVLEAEEEDNGLSLEKRAKCIAFRVLADREDIAFNEEVFWVQCHDLPFAGMTYKTGSAIGERLGKVLTVDTDSSGVYIGAFLRIKKELGAAIGEGIEQQYGPWLRANWKLSAGVSLSEGAAKSQLHCPASNPDPQQTGDESNSGQMEVEDNGIVAGVDIQVKDSSGEARPNRSVLMDLGQRKNWKKRARSSSDSARHQVMDVDGCEPNDWSSRGQETEGTEESPPKRVKRVQGEAEGPILPVAAEQPWQPPPSSQFLVVWWCICVSPACFGLFLVSGCSGLMSLMVDGFPAPGSLPLLMVSFLLDSFLDWGPFCVGRFFCLVWGLVGFWWSYMTIVIASASA